MFDHIAYEQVEHRAFYEIDSAEGFWNTGRPAGTGANLGYKMRQKEGYFPVPPADSLANLRGEMVLDWRRSGSAASSTITRSPPAARARSTCASSRSCRWPTR